MNGWQSIRPSYFRDWINNMDNVAALFILKDCMSCRRFLNAVPKSDFHRYGLDTCIIEFTEMLPAEISLMRDLRVSVTPQLRIYKKGQVIAAWQELNLILSDVEIRAWNADCLDKIALTLLD